MASTAGKGPIVLVGAGNMGGAMLAGWLKSGVAASDLLVLDPGPAPAMAALMAEHGVTHATAAPAGLSASMLFLAVKPQVMDAVLPPLKGLVGPDTVIVSVAAGKTLAFLESHLGAAGMVRAMPNTPAMIGRGVTGAFANDRVTPEARASVHELLAVSGPVEWVDTEEKIDAVTAVSGSGRPMSSILSSAWRKPVERPVFRRTWPCGLQERRCRGLVNFFTGPPMTPQSFART